MYSFVSNSSSRMTLLSFLLVSKIVSIKIFCGFGMICVDPGIASIIGATR